MAATGQNFGDNPIAVRKTDHYVQESITDFVQKCDELVGDSSAGYLDRMTEGLQHWVDAGRAGHLAWGVIVLDKPTA